MPELAAYVRWKIGTPRESRVFPPLDEDHPGSCKICPACEEPIGTTKQVQLLAIGPDSPDRFIEHVDGHWYSALAILIHATCLGSERAWAAEMEPLTKNY